MKATRVIKFRPGTDFDQTGWHIAHNPTGMDSTLCGLAWEGLAHSPIGKAQLVTYDAKEGRPTCENCRSIVEFCLTLK